MEWTREIYWNVGGGATTLVPMYLFAVVAFAVVAWAFWQRGKTYRRGQPLLRQDELAGRLVAALHQVLSQARVLRVHGAGTAHACFFWGFLLLTLGTTLIFIQTDLLVPLFELTFLKGRFYLLFSVTLDVAGAVAIVMLLGLLLRRYLLRPVGLENQRGDLLVHLLLLVILVTGFVIEGARMAVTEQGTYLAAWSPVGRLVATMLVGFGEAGLRTLHAGLWWLHLLLALAFIALIPFTRLRHLFTTSANYLFVDHGPKGMLTTLNLEDEKAESFGAATLAELSWKDLLDGDACTYCKRCQDRCPAWATDKPLSPMKVVNQIQQLAFAKEEQPLIETVGKDAIWACTTCRACQESCPATIEHIPKLVAMRRHLALMAGEFPGDEVTAAMSQTEVNGNPLGMAFASRGDWAQELGVKTLAEDAQVDIVYFVGCYASFDRRNIQVAKSFIRLCQAAGLKVGILGKEEKCCGEPMRKLGNEYLYQSMAAENIAALQKYGAKQIVTTCPHCFSTLAKDYRDLGLEIPVEHYTTFLARLLERGTLKLRQQGRFACTYHDSCYLGRHNDIYSAPRALIAMAGGELTEMARHGSESFCCGGGGGRILAEEKLGTRIGATRAMMAVATGTPLLLSSCPFCLTMFEDGVKGAGAEKALAPRDLAEVLAERLPGLL